MIFTMPISASMYRLTISLLSTLLIGWTHAQIGTLIPGVKEVTPLELSTLLGHVRVIDVNEADNFAYAHVPGAKLLAYDAIKPEDLPADKTTPLVFYCWSPECPAAGMAAKTAVSLGHTDVACMPAGITGWQDAGLPTEP